MARQKNTRKIFWSHVDKQSSPIGCWLWTGLINNKGYGQIGWHGRSQLAHRVAWQLTRGDIPLGLHRGTICVLHRCDTAGCVKPSHLFLGTHSENMIDKKVKGRSPKGSAHWTSRIPWKMVRGEAVITAKLTESQVASIRLDARLQREIAFDYGVSPSQISRIRSGVRWRQFDAQYRGV